MNDEQTEQTIEILGDDSNSRDWMKYVKDNDGNYYVPTIDESAKWGESLKESLRLTYQMLPNHKLDEFDSAWPDIWKLQKKHKTDEPIRIATAVLDSGVLLDHPIIADCIWKPLDITGEGANDIIGHGTIVALQLCITSFLPVNLISIKVVSSKGNNPANNIIKGLKLLQEIKEKEQLQSITANLSIGVYSKRLGLFECDGSCEICQAAIEAAENDIMIVAASGNKAGKTACPATAGVREKHPNIYAIGSSDFSDSGASSFVTPSKLRFKPVT
jgi:hypothetical protein